MDFFVNFSLQRTLTVGNSTHFALICTSSLCGIHKKLFNMENCTKKIKISSYNEYLISFSTKSWKNTKRAINIFFHFPQNLGRMEKVVVMENIVESAYFSFFILPRFCWKFKVASGKNMKFWRRTLPLTSENNLTLIIVADINV